MFWNLLPCVSTLAMTSPITHTPVKKTEMEQNIFQNIKSKTLVTHLNFQ